MFPQTTADEQEQGLTTDVEEEYEADSFQPEEAFARLWGWEKTVLETSFLSGLISNERNMSRNSFPCCHHKQCPVIVGVVAAQWGAARASAVSGLAADYVCPFAGSSRSLGLLGVRGAKREMHAPLQPGFRKRRVAPVLYITMKASFSTPEFGLEIFASVGFGADFTQSKRPRSN